MVRRAEPQPVLRVESFPQKNIYGFVDPSTGDLFYIGRSSSGIGEPMRYFTRANKDDRHVHRKIRSLWRRGLRPYPIVLESLLDNATDDDLNMAEIALIAFFKRLRHRLTNKTDGGQGTLGYHHRENSKRLIGQKNSIALLGNDPWNKGTKTWITRTCALDSCRRPFVVGKGSDQRYHDIVCYREAGQSEDARRKNSEAHRGRRHPTTFYEKTAATKRKQVICLNDGITHSSIRSAAAFYGILADTVGRICRGIRGPTRSGLRFAFLISSDASSTSGRIPFSDAT